MMELGTYFTNQDKQQYLETFLHIVRGSKNKNEFLKNVQEFDNKFTEAFQGPSFQNKASYESFQSAQQMEIPPQKPKNPFINQNDDYKRNYSPSRSNNFIPQQQQASYYNQPGNMPQSFTNKMNIQPSRSEQDFFKPPPATKTYLAGFNPKEYERQNYTQEFGQLPPKGPNFVWQTSENFNQPPQYIPRDYYEQEMKQNFNEMKKNFANFNINDQQKYSSFNNDLSIHSNHNLQHTNSGIDSHPNEFLAAFSREDEGLAKYYKAAIPYPPKQDNQSSRAYLEKRVNPFANQ